MLISEEGLGVGVCGKGWGSGGDELGCEMGGRDGMGEVNANGFVWW